MVARAPREPLGELDFAQTGAARSARMMASQNDFIADTGCICRKLTRRRCQVNRLSGVSRGDVWAGGGGLTVRSPSSKFSDMNWISWALLSAFFAGITAVLAKVGVAGVDSNLATAVRTTVVLVFTWGIALATSPAASFRQLSNRTLMFLALSGIATVSHGCAIFAPCNWVRHPASRRWTS